MEHPRTLAHCFCDYAVGWLDPCTNSKDRVVELVVLEQFLEALGPVLELWVWRQGPGNGAVAAGAPGPGTGTGGAAGCSTTDCSVWPASPSGHSIVGAL
ncbi:UNVERIFIED_CONTAM: hypothetical protein FKN15_047761 [Acipenser sinensis]